MNFVELIRAETKDLAGKTAIVEGDRRITYGELFQRIDELRQTFAVQPGQRIAFRCADGIDYVVGSLAILSAGAAVVPVADSVTKEEAAETIEKIDVAGVLSLANDGLGFRWRSRPSNPEMDARCRELDAAFVRFSSGTTGESKGVVLSHRAIEDRTAAANHGLGITERDVILWVLAMSHHFVVSILLFLRRGATIVVANRLFPFSMLEAIEQNPITFIYASPVHYFLLACSEQATAQSLADVRLAISTAMKMPEETLELFFRKFNFAPAEAYGIIEIGLPLMNTESSLESRRTVGRILPDYELRIADADSEGVGEVLIRGNGMFDAYFSPWRLRDECLRDGWFDTGDLGKLDSAGRLSLLGRSKTVIVSAGMKVFPEEVEETINSVPGVRESLVRGQAHPQYGQVPVAEVVLAGEATATVEQIRRHCFKRLSSYKVPVEFRIVQTLPKTASGKLARSAL